MRASSYDVWSGAGSRRTSVRSIELKIAKAIRAGKAREGQHTERDGKRLRAVMWELHWQMDCTEPVRVHYTAARDYSKRRDGKRQPRECLELLSCRKCEACVRSKARFWAARAFDETELAARTWMGTFTLSPDQHAVLDLRVAERTGNRPLTAVELLRERTSVFGQYVTEWLKRVRTASFERTGRSGSMRYLLVAEVHDSENTGEGMRGRPHYHMLLHEAFVGALISVDEYFSKWEKVGDEVVESVYAADSAMVRKTWEYGFTKFVLCRDSKSAYYLCKYMTKSLGWRVRASQRYGTGGVPWPPDIREAKEVCLELVKADGEQARPPEEEEQNPSSISRDVVSNA